MLAKKRSAAFEGVGFILTDNFSDSEERRLLEVLMAIPTNIVSWYLSDLYSRKMGSLLTDYLSREENDLRRHEMHLILIRSRPQGWKSRIEKYIGEVSRNSFYLLDIYNSLSMEYRYAFVPGEVLSEMRYLLKMVLVKHELGIKRPGEKVIGKVRETGLPTRANDDE
jgi:hypothetical protein